MLAAPYRCLCCCHGLLSAQDDSAAERPINGSIKQGVFLNFVGKTFAGNIVLIMTVLVGSESASDWSWALNQLLLFLPDYQPLQRGPRTGMVGNADGERRVSFIADKGLGLISAIADVLPGHELNFCVRHREVQQNFVNVRGSRVAVTACTVAAVGCVASLTLPRPSKRCRRLPLPLPFHYLPALPVQLHLRSTRLS